MFLRRKRRKIHDFFFVAAPVEHRPAHKKNQKRDANGVASTLPRLLSCNLARYHRIHQRLKNSENILIWPLFSALRRRGSPLDSNALNSCSIALTSTPTHSKAKESTQRYNSLHTQRALLLAPTSLPHTVVLPLRPQQDPRMSSWRNTHSTSKSRTRTSRSLLPHATRTSWTHKYHIRRNTRWRHRTTFPHRYAWRRFLVSCTTSCS